MERTSEHIRVFEAFAGIGAQAEALKELGLDYEVVGISEIDKDAITGYEAIHGPVRNYGDIRLMEKLPDCDLLTYSYPCTSVSISGKQEGMKEGTGTASSLVWEVGRLLKTADHLPKYLVMENVDAVLNYRNLDEFTKWMDMLKELGYTSTYAILNAKDFDTPQFRKRCFMVSSLAKEKFIFPRGQMTTKCMRDILDPVVSDSYYLPFRKTVGYKEVHVKNANGLIKTGDLACYRYQHMNRVYSPRGIAPTVNTAQGGGRAVKIFLYYEAGDPVIRHLTPTEYFRLQGFPNDAIRRLTSVIKSKTRQYKLAGNSIPVGLLKAIFEGIYIKKTFRRNFEHTALDEYFQSD